MDMAGEEDFVDKGQIELYGCAADTMIHHIIIPGFKYTMYIFSNFLSFVYQNLIDEGADTITIMLMWALCLYL